MAKKTSKTQSKSKPKSTPSQPPQNKLLTGDPRLKPKRPPKPKTVAPSPSWTLDKGVSQSLLNRFLGCRERFRLYAVEGMREGGSRDQMDFGTYFHDLLENYSRNPNHSAEAIILMTQKSVNSRCPNLSHELRQVCETIFNRYVWYFSETKYHYVDQEAVFDVNYAVPGYRTIRLRGRFDEIILRPDGTIWIQENKTKEKINAEQLVSTIPLNLQTMLYAVAAQLHYGKKVSGIVYNVIRKPTSKPSKVKMNKAELEAWKAENPKSKALQRQETQFEFLERLDNDIESRPEHYFLRWEYGLTDSKLELWRKHVLDPILISLIQWWESVKHDPFSPWEERDEKGNLVQIPDTNGKGHLIPLPNPHHWQRPFGVYDSMTNSVGDFYEVLALGKRTNVTVNNIPFQELQEN